MLPFNAKSPCLAPRHYPSASHAITCPTVFCYSFVFNKIKNRCSAGFSHFRLPLMSSLYDIDNFDMIYASASLFTYLKCSEPFPFRQYHESFVLASFRESASEHYCQVTTTGNTCKMQKCQSLISSKTCLSYSIPKLRLDVDLRLPDNLLMRLRYWAQADIALMYRRLFHHRYYFDITADINSRRLFKPLLFDDGYYLFPRFSH